MSVIGKMIKRAWSEMNAKIFYRVYDDPNDPHINLTIQDKVAFYRHMTRLFKTFPVALDKYDLVKLETTHTLFKSETEDSDFTDLIQAIKSHGQVILYFEPLSEQGE